MIFRKPTRPRCEECGRTPCHPYKQKGVDGDGLIVGLGYVWLCGDCRYAQENPHAAAIPPKPLPQEEKVPLQTERLFPL